MGKTVLARHLADPTGLPTTYWAAEPEPAGLQRRKLYACLLDVTMTQAPLFESWADLWAAFAKMLGSQRRVLILDEIPYAAEADPAFLSSIQHAWDQQFKDSQLVLLLSGSHVHAMETLLARGSPLVGRFTGQWHLQPLEFSALSHFVPKWSADEWVARMSEERQLPFQVQHVGTHWSREVQVDVVGINWQERALLLGECKWGKDVVPRETVVELIETKTPRVLRALPDAGKRWTVHYCFFSRGGLTPAAMTLAQEHQATLVDLRWLDEDLRG